MILKRKEVIKAWVRPGERVLQIIKGGRRKIRGQCDEICCCLSLSPFPKTSFCISFSVFIVKEHVVLKE